MQKQRLTTTLSKIEELTPCYKLINRFLTYYDKDYDFNKEKKINLLEILESNGVEDTLYVLEVTEQNPSVISKLIAADFAESVLPIYKNKYPDDKTPENYINAARGLEHLPLQHYFSDENDEEGITPAESHARCAALSVFKSAFVTSFYACAAAYHYAGRCSLALQKETEKQKEIIKKYLTS